MRKPSKAHRRRAIRATIIRQVQNLIEDAFMADGNDRGKSYGYHVERNDPVCRDMLKRIRQALA